MGEDTRNDATNAGVRPVMVGLAAVVALLIGVGATLLVSALRSAPATPTQSGELLVVSADTAQMDMTAGQAYLSLIGVDPQTLWFTDRPQRLSGVMATDILVEQWPQYFETSQPNAALTYRVSPTPQSPPAPVAVELGVPEQSDDTVRFPITGLTEADLPAGGIVLEGPRLFIDPPAARLTDFHESPMLVPAVPQIPRVGGPTPSVYVGGLPGAKIGDKLVVVGPPSSIIKAPQSTPPDVAPSD